MLNEGTIVIQRQGAAVNTSDEEEDSEVDEVKEEEEEVVEEPEPERDPLDVEEEALQEKLQTAGFLLSMPEEEHIRKRLLEIKWVSVFPPHRQPRHQSHYQCHHLQGGFEHPSSTKTVYLGGITHPYIHSPTPSFCSVAH